MKYCRNDSNAMCQYQTSAIMAAYDESGHVSENVLMTGRHQPAVMAFGEKRENINNGQ